MAHSAIAAIDRALPGPRLKTMSTARVSSVYGMNIIVNDRTDFPHLTVVLAAMLVISAIVLRWAKRQEWW